MEYLINPINRDAHTSGVSFLGLKRSPWRVTLVNDKRLTPLIIVRSD